jgi:ketosteroid isomerase-like protein
MRKLFIVFCLTGCLPLFASADPLRSVAATLDAFHGAAARADLETYLGLLTPEAVFLGTDGSERWQGEEFRQFVSGHFNERQGWAYTADNRHVTLSADGRLAWFDEALTNAKYGQCRGSGVLVLEAGIWRIDQYNLSVPVPNDLMESVVASIRAMESDASVPSQGVEAGPD